MYKEFLFPQAISSSFFHTSAFFFVGGKPVDGNLGAKWHDFLPPYGHVNDFVVKKIIFCRKYRPDFVVYQNKYLYLHR